MAARRARRPATTPAPEAQAATSSDLARAAAALVGGRLSVDTSYQIFGNIPNLLLPPTSAESQWQLYQLDQDALERIPPTKLLELLADLSPDISRALWDFLRLCNPGWEVTAVLPDGETQHEIGTAALAAFFDRLAVLYGSADIPINRLFTAAFLRGAAVAELVLSQDLRQALDLVTPDPMSVRFKRFWDPVRGQIWVPGQWQGGLFVLLDRPTVQYLPVDPLPGNPYGRPIAAPALFSCLFLLGLLHDLRRVVRQQGYPRLDVEIVASTVQQYLTAMNVTDVRGFETAVTALLSSAKDSYAGLQPDDAFFHTDAVKINRPVGATDASSLGAVDGLITMLERMTTRALKSMPVLMGTTQGTTETQANREWEIMAAGIKSLQHLVEAVLQRLCDVILRAQGIQAHATFRFAELRASEMLRDEQTLALKLSNAINAYSYGFVGMDEASQMAVGHPADMPEPRETASTATPSGGAPGATEGAGSGTKEDGQEPGKGRAVGTRATAALRPAGAALPGVPDRVTFAPIERDGLLAAWAASQPPAYRMLLDAEVITGTGGRMPSDRWQWWEAAGRYRDRQTGRFLSPTRSEAVFHDFLDHQERAVADLSGQLADERLNLAAWETGMGDVVKQTTGAAFVFGRGGRNAMTTADWALAGALVVRQLGYLHAFATDLEAGALTAPQMAARSQMYVSSATGARWRGTATARGLSELDLPNVPGDGSTSCRARCRCSTDIQETEDGWAVYWQTAGLNTCDDCADRGRDWSPLVIAR